MIVAAHLEKRFGTVVALRGASFTAMDGQVTGLVGPNGAGKSTLLRVLYAALRPDAGDAHVDDLSCITAADAVRARLGVLPHATGLYPNLTARENVRYYAQLQGLRGSAADAAVDEVLQRFELGEIASRRVHGFSQGQRLKVALSRALVHRPRNIILDEPTNGLDVVALRSLRELIRSLRDEGRCILLASHALPEVSSLCDRVAIIAAGRVIASGSPAEILAQAGVASLEEAFMALTVSAGAGGPPA